MEKSADAYRTISEVAVDLDVPQHVLRFWETKFTQIKPLKRGGGRRYYRPGDVDLLRTVRRLLYGEGYTIRGVQQILKRKGVRTVALIDAAGQGLAQSPAVPDGPMVLRNADEDGQIEMEPQQKKFPEPLPDDFFDRPVANPVLGVERWRIVTLVEELRACAKILAAAQSRHAETAGSRNGPSHGPRGYSGDAP